jgi:hypothetical protein
MRQGVAARRSPPTSALDRLLNQLVDRSGLHWHFEISKLTRDEGRFGMHYRKLEDFPVQKKVHSLAVDPETHRGYAPEQEANGKTVARMVVYEAVMNR